MLHNFVLQPYYWRILFSPGSCPRPIVTFESAVNCRADYGGCRYDSECGSNQKCCRNEDCHYSECKDSVIVQDVSTRIFLV